MIYIPFEPSTPSETITSRIPVNDSYPKTFITLVYENDRYNVALPSVCVTNYVYTILKLWFRLKLN